jgi:DNA (cytosine-5)-methyltransferase 1
MKRPVAIDLFSGAGGLSLGFEQAGFDIVAAVELDPIHCATHSYNFPYCKTICRDVADLTGKEIRKLAGLGNKTIDVVFGGAPCQGFSLIGKRALDDPRNGLVCHFVRLVLEINPRHFVFENVKGLTIGKHRKFLEEIISTFEENGYSVVEDYQVLNAADYGVPQDRRRLFLLGARKNSELPSYPPTRPQNRVTVWEALGDLPEVEKFPELLNRDWVRPELCSTALNPAYSGLFTLPRAAPPAEMANKCAVKHL